MTALSSSPESISLHEEDKGNGIRIDVYYSRKNGLAYCRAYEYIPYRSEPCSQFYEYKIEKAKSTLDYVNDRLNEAKADFEEKELAYAQFRDANRDISSATAQIAESRLRQQYDLANTIYSQLASQKVQVELQVKEDTPVLSVIKPIVVPVEKSKPKRAVILIAFTFLGGCLGCASVFGLDFLKHQGSSWPRSWKTEEEEDDEKSNLSEEAVA